MHCLARERRFEPLGRLEHKLAAIRGRQTSLIASILHVDTALSRIATCCVRALSGPWPQTSWRRRDDGDRAVGVRDSHPRLELHLDAYLPEPVRITRRAMRCSSTLRMSCHRRLIPRYRRSGIMLEYCGGGA